MVKYLFPLIATFLATFPSHVEAQGSCPELTRSGNSIVGGSSSCYYVVMQAFGSWKKECKGTGGSLSCANLAEGTHRVDSYLRSPWAQVNSFDIDIPSSSGSSGCAALTQSGNSLSGGDSDCYYVVMEAFGNWQHPCTAGRGGTLSCDNLSEGAHRVDSFIISPWTTSTKFAVDIPGATPPSAGVGACTGSVRFFDDFNGSELDPAKWKTGFYWDTNGVPSSAGGHQTYVADLNDDVFNVHNGILEITPRRVGDTHFSGALTAQADGVDLKFERSCFEIRARFPDRAGVFAAFWAISNKGPEWLDPAPAGGGAGNRPEIDVIETIGEDKNVFFTTAHNLGPGDSREARLPAANWNTGTDVTGEFHTYSALWEKNDGEGIVWYLDGVEIKRIGKSMYTPDMFVHLNYALGLKCTDENGNEQWACNGVDNSFFDGGAPPFEIEYIKVTSPEALE